MRSIALAILASVLFGACGGGDVGASCSGDDACGSGLTCDVHGGVGTCQPPHHNDLGTGAVDLAEVTFHNTGLHNLDGAGAYPSPNRGVLEIIGKATDMGRFRVPTLRNIAVTGPYMHDGSIATLAEVLDHYAARGRTIATGPNAGVGSTNPFKSAFLVGFTLSAQERADVLAFFDSLTDTAFLSDQHFSNP